jgi:hypothetical protein
MYDENESGTSSEESSRISSIDSDTSENSDESEGEVADDETVAVRKIKVELENILTKGIVIRRLNLAGDDDAVDSYINTSINVIKNLDRIENYNVELVALAACYDMLFKGIVNEKNITEFISLKIIDHAYDPIDIIRYVTLYVSKK